MRKDITEKAYVKGMLKCSAWEKCDMKKKVRKIGKTKRIPVITSWSYGVIYSNHTKEYFLAEIFFIKEDKPYIWGKVDFSGDNESELLVQAYQFLELLKTPYKVHEIDKEGRFLYD